MNYEWDEKKAEANRQKHGVSFEEAWTVFEDIHAVIFDDEAHAQDEPREIILGYSRQNRLLLVCFVQRDTAIRLITARPATRWERKDYEDYA